jgi:hypothetical protein
MQKLTNWGAIRSGAAMTVRATDDKGQAVVVTGVDWIGMRDGIVVTDADGVPDYQLVTLPAFVPPARSYPETYDMRSRHYQLLGQVGMLMADAFMQADSENQRDIGANVLQAMQHHLIEINGYTAEDLAKAFT